MVVRHGTINKVRGNQNAQPRGIMRLPRRLGREHRLLPTVQAVAASSTAFLDCPVGFTYDAIHLLYGGTTFDATHMSAVRIIANGQVIHNCSGTIRNVINQFDKLPNATSNKVLTIPFKRINLKDGSDEYTALATLLRCEQAPEGIRTLRVEVDIDGTAVAPTLSIYATVRANARSQSRALLRTETFVEVVPALSAAEYTHVHKYNGDPLRPMLHRLTMNQANTEITNIKQQLDTKEIFNRDSKLNDHGLQIYFIRSPQGGYVIIDSSEDGYSHPWRIGDQADHRIITKHATGNYNLTVVAESLGALAG